MGGGFEFYAQIFLEVALICHLLIQLLRPTSPAHGFVWVGHLRQCSLGGTLFPTFFPTQTSRAASQESAFQCFSPPLPRPGARSGKCLLISHVCVCIRCETSACRGGHRRPVTSSSSITSCRTCGEHPVHPGYVRMVPLW